MGINGAPIVDWTEMADRIMESRGATLDFEIRRDGRTIEMSITPEDDVMENIFGESQHRYIIGVGSSGAVITLKIGPADAFIESLNRTFLICKLTVLSVVKVFQGAIPAKTIGGPILIAQMAGEQVEQGLVSLLAFIALISVNLGILNLLPVPVLDGGHILFFSIEAVIGRPVSLKTREIAQQIGIFLLMMLMVFVFYNDIMRFFEK